MWYKLLKWIEKHPLSRLEVLEEDGWDSSTGYEGFTKYRGKRRVYTLGIEENPLTTIKTLEFEILGRKVRITGAYDHCCTFHEGITIIKHEPVPPCPF